MTPKEIKALFGIDIGSESRTRYVAYIKCLYINQEYVNQYGVTFKEIGETMGLARQTVGKLFKNTEKYQSQEFFNRFSEAYQKRCKTTFNNTLKDMLDKSYKHKRIIEKPALSPSGAPLERWPGWKIKKALLNGRHDHPLWDKPMPDFSKRDYEELHKLLDKSWDVQNSTNPTK